MRWQWKGTVNRDSDGKQKKNVYPFMDYIFMLNETFRKTVKSLSCLLIKRSFYTAVVGRTLISIRR